MTFPDKLEAFRKWLSLILGVVGGIITVMLIPLMILVRDNERMRMRQMIDESFVNRMEYAKYVADHKDFADREVKRIDGRFENVDTRFESFGSKLDAMNAKIDAVNLNLRAVQIKLDTETERRNNNGGK